MPPEDESTAAKNDSAKATADRLGLDMDDIRRGWARLGPIVRPISRLTPNKVDDALVAFLDAFLAPTA